MMFGLVIAFPLAVLAVWQFMHAREKRRAANNLPRHSGLRLAIASMAAVVAIFSGGCGAIIGVAELMRPASGAADDFMSWQFVAFFTLPPLLIAGFIWWLAMQRRKN